MGEWCIQHHGESGLTEKVQKSSLSLKDCESQVIEFVQEWTPKGKCPLAGNSVGQDGKFLEKHMPDFMAHLHYRSVNVYQTILIVNCFENPTLSFIIINYHFQTISRLNRVDIIFKLLIFYAFRHINKFS